MRITSPAHRTTVIEAFFELLRAIIAQAHMLARKEYSIDLCVQTNRTIFIISTAM